MLIVNERTNCKLWPGRGIAFSHKHELSQQRRLHMTPEQCSDFYAEHYGKMFFPSLVSFMSRWAMSGALYWLIFTFKHMFNTCVILIIYLQCNLLSSKYFSGSIIAMVLAKENCILEWRDLLGPTSSHRARETHPDRFLSVLISSYAHIWISEYPQNYNFLLGPVLSEKIHRTILGSSSTSFLKQIIIIFLWSVYEQFTVQTTRETPFTAPTLRREQRGKYGSSSQTVSRITAWYKQA